MPATLNIDILSRTHVQSCDLAALNPTLFAAAREPGANTSLIGLIAAFTLNMSDSDNPKGPGWFGKGEERMRRFKLYQELEARYKQLRAEKEALEADMLAKDTAIIALAKQLAFAGTITDSEPVSSVQASTMPHRSKSGTMTRVAAASAPKVNQTLAELLRSTEDAVRANLERPTVPLKKAK